MMSFAIRRVGVAFACIVVASIPAGRPLPAAAASEETVLPAEVKAVWGLDKSYRETTTTREQISINGLWRWQPAGNSEHVPQGNWGYFKVPGCWPGRSDYLQQDCQMLYAHPSWKQSSIGETAAAWYQREITVPAQWTGRRIKVSAEYVNSYAAVYIDGKRAGEIRFPAGEVDITSLCRPGAKTPP